MRVCFTILAFAILLVNLLPLKTLPNAWAMPDLLLGFACAWSVRKPSYVPILLLAALLLLSDLLLQRPPGLWAVLVLLCCENLKRRAQSLKSANFAIEWTTVATHTLGAMLAYRLTLAILLIEQPSLGLHLIETIMTIICYPIVVFTTHAIMRVQKSAPSDLDRSGRRI